MTTLACLLHLTDAYPLWRAWQANRDTTLLYAVGWAVLAWVGWGALLALGALSGPAWAREPARLVALSLTGCAGVAVLGARRPGVRAWNFVVLGLLAVMLLPLAEQFLAGGQPLDPVRVVFLGAALAVSVLNYLPTRLGLAALVLGLGCAWAMGRSLGPADGVPGLPADGPGWLCVALAPWLAYFARLRRPGALSAFDRLWLGFRDRFGLVWGQRLREQFNRAAANAGWPVRLSWQGLRPAPPGGPERDAILATLRAMLKRFLGPEQ